MSVKCQQETNGTATKLGPKGRAAVPYCRPAARTGMLSPADLGRNVQPALLATWMRRAIPATVPHGRHEMVELTETEHAMQDRSGGRIHGHDFYGHVSGQGACRAMVRIFSSPARHCPMRLFQRGELRERRRPRRYVFPRSIRCAQHQAHFASE